MLSTFFPIHITKIILLSLNPKALMIFLNLAIKSFILDCDPSSPQCKKYLPPDIPKSEHPRLTFSSNNKNGKIQGLVRNRN
jgi:hypothetical protein